MFQPRLIYLPDHYKGNSLMNSYKPVARDLPCDIHLINLRTMVAVRFPENHSRRFVRFSQIQDHSLLILFPSDSFDILQPPKSSSGNGANPSDKVALVLHRQVFKLKHQLYQNPDFLMKTEEGRQCKEFSFITVQQGFTSCFRPLGMTCSTNGGKISVDELFPELFRWIYLT